MNDRDDQLKSLIQNGQIDRAIKMVQNTNDHYESKNFVATVLRNKKSTPELVEATLETFLGTRENRYRQHGYWVHSLSYFTEILWERRMVKWIKKFNEASFKGANELRDANCSDRLVCDFGDWARFDDSPDDFALTPKNLRWMNWSNCTNIEYFKARIEYSKARIEAGRFKSEEAFLRWKLRRPEIQVKFDWNVGTNLVNINEIRSLIQRLQELDVDTSEFNSLERDVLTKWFGNLEAELLEAAQDWYRKQLEEYI